MIEFKCPDCGELNEVSDRKAGMVVRCVKCDERIDVPDEKARKRRREKTKEPPRVRDWLSREEYITFGLIFLLVPGVNAIGSTVLYFMWRDQTPTKAYQVNQLGWVIFLLHCIPLCVCCCIGMFAGPQDHRRVR